MTAKEYLLQAYLLDQRIDSKIEQVEALRCLTTKSTAVIRSNPVSGGGNDNFFEDVIIRIVDMEREISEEINRLVELKNEITGVINQVGDPEWQTLLELRYLCYKDWPEIINTMNRGKTTIHRMHNKAMEKIEKIIANKQKSEPNGTK